jgi:hypothetical protein
VFGADAVSLVSARFVEQAGRPEHQSLFPIQGEPVPGALPARVGVRVSAPIANAIVDAVNAEGQVLESGGLLPDTSTDSVLTDFLASLRVPSQAFRLRIRGTDMANRAVDLLNPIVFTPSPVRVEFVGRRMTARPGTSIELPLRITNTGSVQDFSIELTVTPTGVPTSVNPSSLHLEQGQMAEVTATLQIPAVVAENSAIQVRAVAQGSTATNVASARVRVEAGAIHEE